jgi:type I restriction enzyme, S subunit
MTHSKSKIQNPILSLPRYERYKDSGIEWLGDVPEHWEVEKGLRYLFETEDRSVKGDEELLSVSHLTGVTPRSEKNITMFMAESYEGSKLCDVGDIAINTMWAWMSALGVSKYRGLVSPSYGTYRQRKPERFNPTFLDHLIRTDVYRSHYTVNSTGITTSRLRLYPHSFLRLKFVCPPRDEQDRIVAFLDQKTAEIDALIAKKQRQIELLDEQKAILINRAVTRGLNPNAKLKPSGIEWIGDIPEHWEVKNLKHVSTMIGTGRTPSSVAQAEDLPDGVHWYTPGDYQNSGFLDASDRRAKSTRSETVETFPAGSLFYIGIGATLGRVNLSLHEAGCNQQINVIVINSLAHSAEYMLHLLNSGREFIFSSSDFTTLPILNRSKTAALSVVAPPKDEQEAVAAVCADLILKIQAVQAKVVENIQSLKNLRSTLIAHAVTGTIRVEE